MWIWGLSFVLLSAVTLSLQWAQRAAIANLRRRMGELEKSASRIEAAAQQAISAAEEMAAGFAPFPDLQANWLLAAGVLCMLVVAGGVICYSVLHGVFAPLAVILGLMLFFFFRAAGNRLGKKT